MKWQSVQVSASVRVSVVFLLMILVCCIDAMDVYNIIQVNANIINLTLLIRQ